MDATQPVRAGARPAVAPATARGARITAAGVTVVHANGTVALDGVNLTVEAGHLTAVIGPSGAGKSTLLRALAGLVATHDGTISVDAADPGAGSGLGFVPQDDILHGELPLRRTLRYAARLRMHAPAAVLDAAVDDAMETLGLTEYGDLPVRSLSGGQRKRASIATEILTRPGVCFLDEPTSGLDPATAADLVEHLHRMCDEGGTVVFTTHSVEDIRHSDRVVVLAPRGRVLAVGTPDEVLREVGAATFAELYARVATDAGEQPPARPETARAATPRRASSWASTRSAHGPGGFRQWTVLTRRSAELLTRNRLTLAILLGSPAAVISMFGILFRPHGFAAGADPIAAVQVVYWLSFAGFFFGLTFGLLQVATEVPVLSREHHAGMRIGAYLMSKIALLMPVLLLVDAVMLVVLRALDRIPSLSLGTAMQLYVTMGLNALAALCLGLLASAAVGSTAQAALALPMLCFPAVLFAGAMVPLPVMADAGRVIAAAMSDRWAFEAIARSLDVSVLAGPASPYRSLGGWPMPGYWALLAGFTVGFGVLAYLAVRRRATA